MTFSKKDKYTFDISEYEIVEEIKRGGFGIVNLVRNKNTKKKFAAKTNLINTGMSIRQGRQIISREVGILIRVKHPTIISFRGYSTRDFTGNQNITILMDYMKGGSLSDLIKLENRGLAPSNYDNTKRQIILIGISRAMMLLHQFHIIHRDIKPENILLDEDLHPRITDFGLSKFFDPHHSTTQSKSDTGTAAYMAPEVIESVHYNTKADVYAFGILMNELLSGKRAYSNLLNGPKKISIFQLKRKVCEGLRPDIDSKMKKGLRLIIEHCLSSDPKQRPSFREIYNKLSLSQEDSIFQFESSYSEPNVINDTEEDENEEDKEYYEDESDPAKLLLNMRYCLNDVDVNEILDYVDEINVDDKNDDDEDDKKDKEISQLKEIIESMKNKDKEKEDEINKLKDEIKKLKDQNKLYMKNHEELIEKVEDMSETIEKQKKETEKVLNISKNVEDQMKCIKYDNQQLLTSEANLDSPGLLEQLKKKEKSKFEPFFISSQSSNDPYNLIDPNSTDYFSTSDSGKFFIEIELEESIMINGIQIFSDTQYFPKSFDISIDDKIIKSIKESTELNGPNKILTLKIKPIPCRKIRFIQTGPNWDKNTNYLFIKRIELLSGEPKYSTGIFSTLIKRNEHNDPHKIHVFITTSDFDLNRYYLLDSMNNPKDNIWTRNKKNSWFQIEFTSGFSILNGFRMKRCEVDKLKSYKIICTDDVNKPINDWTTLIKIDEIDKDEHEDPSIYTFSRPSPPTRFVRIIMTDKNWDDNYSIIFYHLDFFGKYI